MATITTPIKSPLKPSTEPTTPATAPTTSLLHHNHQPPPHSTPKFSTPNLASKDTIPSITTTPRHPDPPSSDADIILIPSYSRWFSWNNIHECEVRHLPEFFDGRSPSRNPKVYKYHRNTIIRRFRDNPLPNKKITFTDIRKTIIGDVCSIRRVFDFLETWGLINYTSNMGPKPNSKWEEKESKANAAAAASSDATSGSIAGAETALPRKRSCNGCKTVCTIACFASEKYDMTLCARCYVGNYYKVAGANQSDFKRVEISEELKTDWSDKETLHLLEAIMHYGDDWKKVAEHVGHGRTDKECVARFIKLPFGEQFVGPKVDINEVEPSLPLPPAKKKRLSPLTDASNPIMAQAAFLSALVGVEVAEVAAHAALIALSDLTSGKTKDSLEMLSNGQNQESENGIARMEDALTEARLQLEKEEDELERAVSAIAVQTKEIEEKIVHFEDLELETEKRWQQLQQMENLVFADQLKLLLLNKTAPPSKPEDSSEVNVKAETRVDNK